MDEPRRSKREKKSRLYVDNDDTTQCKYILKVYSSIFSTNSGYANLTMQTFSKVNLASLAKLS